MQNTQSMGTHRPHLNACRAQEWISSQRKASGVSMRHWLMAGAGVDASGRPTRLLGCITRQYWRLRRMILPGLPSGHGMAVQGRTEESYRARGQSPKIEGQINDQETHPKDGSPTDRAHDYKSLIHVGSATLPIESVQMQEMSLFIHMACRYGPMINVDACLYLEWQVPPPFRFRPAHGPIGGLLRPSSPWK